MTDLSNLDRWERATGRFPDQDYRREWHRPSPPGDPLIGYLIYKLPVLLSVLFIVTAPLACLALWLLSMLMGIE